ncbi:uncharacterized protein LOC105196572 [Solenopsis invicta]|uniref:uncharacterized protein LOC105196572 n=1 Tax=Solenopsis invicta TaxID=13686 RepID=UPI0005963AEC|nr:uncharacterized protein LOC105196572 [Solenopsis invicta]
MSHDIDLYDLLRKFWTLKEIPLNTKPHLSSEEQKCEDYFITTHLRDEQGRYIVKLPFKKSVDLLGDSHPKASKLLAKMIYRLNQNKEYSQAYSAFISEYEKLQHMQLVDEDLALSLYTYYLPHHGVWKEQSLTTKLRVVFNESSPTTTGYSLNDILHTGLKLQNDLFDVLIWFRLFHYVFSTDVEKMFRQIKVHSEHWPFQRILWKDDKMRTYELTTVTYGLACAPYLSLRVFLQLIRDEGKKYPLAVPVLEKGRYVDDIFGGADTIEQEQEKLLSN